MRNPLTTTWATLAATVTVAALTATVPAAAATPAPKTIKTAYTTGYTWFDNTPRGSAEISNPILHKQAGGTGTYEDPITIAVGHSIVTRNGKRVDVLDYPAGTRMYVPNVRRYFIVEDSCGDGPTPQNGGCHSLRKAPKGATTWVDLYIGGGRHDSYDAVQNCASHVTDEDGHQLHWLIVNPKPGYKVVKGPLFQNGKCTHLF